MLKRKQSVFVVKQNEKKKKKKKKGKKKALFGTDKMVSFHFK